MDITEVDQEFIDIAFHLAELETEKAIKNGCELCNDENGKDY